MKQAITKLSALSRVYGKEAELYFYYAGHGLPDEVTKEPYLIPVDVSGKDLESAIKLKDIYTEFSKNETDRITIFLDACFSGGARNQGLIQARSVAIKPKETTLSGKIVSFSASSGEESSLPFDEKEHGLFTYYLLKKLKETSGNLSYKELSDAIHQKVALESILTNSKEQNPQTNVSPVISESWSNWKINE